MVNATDEARSAWSEAEALAAQLDAALPLLVVAAQLAGVRCTDTAVLPLACDPANLHRRRVWEAWTTEAGRTRRWGALHKLGCSLRACPADEHQPYRMPETLEYRQTPITGAPAGNYRTTVHDPEDPGYKPAPTPQKGLIGGSMTAL